MTSSSYGTSTRGGLRGRSAQDLRGARRAPSAEHLVGQRREARDGAGRRDVRAAEAMTRQLVQGQSHIEDVLPPQLSKALPQSP